MGRYLDHVKLGGGNRILERWKQQGAAAAAAVAAAAAAAAAAAVQVFSSRIVGE